VRAPTDFAGLLRRLIEGGWSPFSSVDWLVTCTDPRPPPTTSTSSTAERMKIWSAWCAP
jgi:hypothetical protein